MKVPKDYMISLLKKNIIPMVAWSTKYYNGLFCYVIKNPVYCQVFWLDFWHNYVLTQFQNQNMITSVENQNLTLPVIITNDLQFLNIPTIIQNIDYYASPRLVSSPFQINMSMSAVLILFFIIFGLIIAATQVFAKNSIYTSLV
ncbi:PIF-6 [Carcinus maenas nudivirus]|uniref:PIF-6 n=1 Tax=Carcinus maenas nudivirus TaxID=2880837 RepID=A0AAE8Y1C0_9VIRU|nr:PIF-6 [Carcinus maenas nudivirus]UBZ25668.1 PIF-6 [Carcinus maenas nudivirus]